MSRSLPDFLPLPEDDEALILRENCYLYGGPRQATLAKWASRPTEAPITLPYLIVGRRAAYRVGDLRRLLAALRYSNSSQRSTNREKRVRNAALRSNGA